MCLAIDVKTGETKVVGDRETVLSSLDRWAQPRAMPVI
jgi:hypothetical protein